MRWQAHKWQHSPHTRHRDIFANIFSSSALNGKVLYGFLFEFDSLASHHTADLPSSSHSTQFRYNHWLQSQARAHFIYFIAFLRTFPSGGRGQVCRIENGVTFGKEFNLVRFPADTQDTRVTLNDSLVGGLMIMMGRSEGVTSSDRLISEIFPR